MTSCWSLRVGAPSAEQRRGPIRGIRQSRDIVIAASLHQTSVNLPWTFVSPRHPTLHLQYTVLVLASATSHKNQPCGPVHLTHPVHCMHLLSHLHSSIQPAYLCRILYGSEGTSPTVSAGCQDPHVGPRGPTRPPIPAPHCPQLTRSPLTTPMMTCREVK